MTGLWSPRATATDKTEGREEHKAGSHAGPYSVLGFHHKRQRTMEGVSKRRVLLPGLERPFWEGKGGPREGNPGHCQPTSQSVGSSCPSHQAGLCLHGFEPCFTHRHVKGKDRKRPPQMAGLDTALGPNGI